MEAGPCESVGRVAAGAACPLADSGVVRVMRNRLARDHGGISSRGRGYRRIQREALSRRGGVGAVRAEQVKHVLAEFV